MKQFAFSLDRVLDFKTQILDREKGELGRLRQAKMALEHQIDERLEEFEQVSAEKNEKSRLQITAFELRTYQYQLDTLRQEVAELREQVALLEDQIEEQLAKVLEMNQDVSGLDKLKEHQLEAHNQKVAKAEELELSEFISGKLVRQKEA